VVRTFSQDDAKTAGLWGKQGPWSQYPKRMLQLRARGFALRDAFPDALRGIHSADESRDMVIDVSPVESLKEGFHTFGKRPEPANDNGGNGGNGKAMPSEEAAEPPHDPVTGEVRAEEPKAEAMPLPFGPTSGETKPTDPAPATKGKGKAGF
jgi:hypothetical protein